MNAPDDRAMDPPPDTLPTTLTSLDSESIASHDRSLRRLARELLEDQHAADDVVQETWLAALRRGPDQPGFLRRWLGAVTHNLASKARRGNERQARREREVARPESTPSAHEIFERESVHNSVVRAVFALEEPYRTAMVLRFFEELPVPEIAKDLGVPIETVRTRIKRAIGMLRARLDREHGRRSWALSLVALRRRGRGVPHATLRKAAALLGLGLTLRVRIAAVLALGLAAAAWAGLREALPGTSVIEPPPSTAPDPTQERVAARETEPRPVRTLVADPAPSTLGSLRLKLTWRHWNKPASRVGVRVSRVNGTDPHLTGVFGLTDEEGMVFFDRLPEGPVRIDLDRSGGPNVRIEPGRENRVALAMGNPHILEGVVVDPGGSPVEGARVFMPSGVPKVIELDRGMTVAVTGRDGKFRIEGAAQGRPIGAWKAGHAVSDLHVPTSREDANRSIRIVLRGSGGTAAGRVVDASGAPVAGALVELGSTEDLRFVRSADSAAGIRPRAVWTRTDQEGRFRVEAIRPGRIPAQVRAPGLSCWSGSIDVSVRRPVEASIRLEKGPVLKGRILQHDGSPAVAAKVAAGGSHLSSLFTVLTDSNGSFRIEGLSPGRNAVSAHGAQGGWSSTTSSVLNGATLRWDATLAPPRALSGRVLSESGTSAFGVKIEASMEGPWPDPWSVSTSTDVEGRFVVTDCPACPIVLRAFDSQDRLQSVAVTVPTTDASHEILIRLREPERASASITGTVLDPDGGPADDFKVTGLNLDTHDLIQSRTDALGRFRLGPYPPGRYTVQCVNTARGLAHVEHRSVGPGDTWDLGTVRPTPLGSLAVTVRREGCDAPEGLMFPVVRDDGQQMETVVVDQGSTSTYEMAPGRYRLQVRGHGVADEIRAFEIRSGERTSMEVTLRSATPKLLRFRRADGARFKDTLVVVVRDAADRAVVDLALPTPNAASYDFVVGLVPGRFRVEATARDGSRGEEVLAVLEGEGKGQPLEVVIR